MAEAPEVSLGVRCFGCKAPLAAEPLGVDPREGGNFPRLSSLLGVVRPAGRFSCG